MGEITIRVSGFGQMMSERDNARYQYTFEICNRVHQKISEFEIYTDAIFMYPIKNLIRWRNYLNV